MSKPASPSCSVAIPFGRRWENALCNCASADFRMVSFHDRGSVFILTHFVDGALGYVAYTTRNCIGYKAG